MTATHLRVNGKALYYHEQVPIIRYNGKLNDLPERVMQLQPLEFWDLTNIAGTTSIAGRYNGYTGTPTAVTFGAAGVGDGRTAASFDGTTSIIDVYSAALAAAFNGAAGSAGVFFIPSGAGIWTDGARRNNLYFAADANNVVSLHKAGGAFDDNLAFQYTAAGTTQQRLVVGQTGVALRSLIMTWDKAADAVIAYLNGVKQGATMTGLGVWAGALSSSFCIIGAQGLAPANVCSGTQAYAFLATRALTPTEVASIGSL